MLLPNNDSYLFDFKNPPAGSVLTGPGGDLTLANRKTFPALVGTNGGLAVGRLGPCGMNVLHIHPRSAELQLVISGTLVTQQMPEGGVTNPDGSPLVIEVTTGEMQMTPFYQGGTHTQYNRECTNATFIASFSSEDFGAAPVPGTTLAFPDQTINAAFGGIFEGTELELVRAAIPPSIAEGVEDCLRKCNIPLPNPNRGGQLK